MEYVMMISRALLEYEWKEGGAPGLAIPAQLEKTSSPFSIKA